MSRRFAIPSHLSKALRQLRKSGARSHEVLHLSRKIISANLKTEDLMLQNATPLKKSAPWPRNIPSKSDPALGCFFSLLTSKRAWRRHSRVLFLSNTISTNVFFLTCWHRNAFCAAATCNFWSLIPPHGFAPVALANLLSETLKYWKINHLSRILYLFPSFDLLLPYLLFSDSSHACCCIYP